MKTMIYANGIGPLNKNNRRMTKAVVNQVDVITLREELSYREIQNLNIEKPQVFLTADPAVTIEAGGKEEIDEIFMKENINPNEKLIGFSVRKWSDYENTRRLSPGLQTMYVKIMAQSLSLYLCTIPVTF